MITRNLKSYVFNKIFNSAWKYKKIDGTYVGKNISIATAGDGVRSSLYYIHNGYPTRTLRIGTGSTEPTIDDYKLEQMIDVNAKTASLANSWEFESSYTIINAVFLNETDADWIVTEVGDFLSISTSEALLLAREVFDPVTVKPGQTFSISMKLF